MDNPVPGISDANGKIGLGGDVFTIFRGRKAVGTIRQADALLRDRCRRASAKILLTQSAPNSPLHWRVAVIIRPMKFKGFGWR